MSGRLFLRYKADFNAEIESLLGRAERADGIRPGFGPLPSPKLQPYSPWPGKRGFIAAFHEAASERRVSR